MSMNADNLVGLRCHGGFYTGVISHLHWQLVPNRSIYMNIPRIGRVKTIWDRLLLKLKLTFDGLVTSKKVL